MNKMFTLPSNCKIITGINRSILIDLQLEKIYYIPNILAKNLTKNPIISFSEQNEKVSNITYIKNQQLFDFLNTKELLIPYEKNCFPELNLQWFSPSIISNVVLEIGAFNYLNKNLINQFENLGVNSIALLLNTSFFSFKEMYRMFKNTNITSIYLLHHINILN